MKKIFGTTLRPRVSIFRSNRFISGQIIDDEKDITLASSTSKGIEKKSGLERAKEAGKKLGESAKTKKITSIVFDRGSYRYMGQVQAFADGLRESGINF